MTNAPSSMLKEAEIERMMTDTLTERLAAAEALGKAAGKDGLRSRNLNAAGSKRFRAIVKKAVRDVFGGMRPSGRMDPAAIRLLEPLSVIVARKRGELSERNMELLVEALLPANDPMSGSGRRSRPTTPWLA